MRARRIETHRHTQVMVMTIRIIPARGIPLVLLLGLLAVPAHGPGMRVKGK